MGPSPVGDGEASTTAVNVMAGDAASMGPSPVGDGEMTSANGTTDWTLRLQWGRRLLATERLAIRCFVSSQSTLQWGRRLLATERSERSFMTAASFRASMGPSPVGDGEWSFRGRVGRMGRASMGPSPVGDGELVPVAVLVVVLALQWGRRLLATERCCHCERWTPTDSRFNGAVACWRRRA